MPNKLYLECYSGISGDMTVAALLDLGADQQVLMEGLESLNLPGYQLKIGRVKKNGIDACDFDVILDEPEHHHDHDHEHHHDHDHEHEHHHHHDGSCCCGHDHHADEVFQSWGVETPKKFTEAALQDCLTALGDISLGTVLRAKGIVPCADGGWLHFDYVPGMPEIRHGAADYTGRLCVIGAELDEDRLADLFGI